MLESCKVYLSQGNINLGSKSAKLSLKHLGETVFQVTGKFEKFRFEAEGKRK